MCDARQLIGTSRIGLSAVFGDRFVIDAGWVEAQFLVEPGAQRYCFQLLADVAPLPN